MVAHDPVDLRGLPVWERAETVLQEADKLAEGGSFEFFTEVDPRALIARLEQLRPGEFAFSDRNIGDRDWRVRLMRVHIERDAGSLTGALHRSGVLSLLDDNAQARLLESMTEHTARKGQILAAENSGATSLGLLLEGALGIFVGAGSRERLLFHVFPLEIFNEAEFFDGGLSLGRTVVLSKSARYATVPFDIVRTIAMRDPVFMQGIAMVVAQRKRRLVMELAAQVSQPIIARVATALLPYAAPERGMNLALPPLPNMTQAQIAASAGTVKEVAARAIAELERVQALRRERGHIRFLDRSMLLRTIEESS